MAAPMKAVSNSLYYVTIFALIFFVKQAIIYETQAQEYDGFLKMWLLAPLFSIVFFVPNIRGNAYKIKKSGKGRFSILELILWIFSCIAVLFQYGIVESITFQILVMRAVFTEDLNVAGKLSMVKIIDFAFLSFWILLCIIIYRFPLAFEPVIKGCYFAVLLSAIFYGFIRKVDISLYPNSGSLLYLIAGCFVPGCAFAFSEIIDSNELGRFLSLYLIANTLVTTFSLVFNRLIFSYNSKISFTCSFLNGFMIMLLAACFSLIIVSYLELFSLPALIFMFLIGRISYTFAIGMYFNGHFKVGSVATGILAIGMYCLSLVLLGVFGVNVESFFIIIAMPQLLFTLAILVIHVSRQPDA